MITRTVVCEISKEPVLYNKTNVEDRAPVKRKAPQKPETSEVVEATPKELPVKLSEEKPLELSLDEPTLGGHYELSPLLSKMLEAELQDVMTKVWQLLPDNPRDESEKLVVERFRNKAGDDLKNTLGLNVTKRLLNVHNPLYVKIVFSSKPTRADLVNFIKKYNISKFKRVGVRGGTFAAKMQNFQDFDNLCAVKNLKCGQVRVTVTPCYQFTKCPANLRTCYDGKEDSTMNKNNGQNLTNKVESQDETKPIEKDSIKQESANENKQNITAKVTSTKPNESATAKNAEKVTPAKTNVQGTANREVATKLPAKSTPAAAVKQSPITPAKQNPALKVTPAKSTAVAPSQKSDPKATPNKPTAVAQSQSAAQKVTPPKPAAVTQAQNTPLKVMPTKPTTATAKQSAPNNQNSVPKATATKPTNQNAAPKATPSKPAAPTTQKAAPKPTPTKPAPVINQKANQAATSKPTKAGVTKPAESRQKVAPKPKQKSPKKKHEGDYDELDDHDILALISEGIVLDECSGSEED